MQWALFETEHSKRYRDAWDEAICFYDTAVSIMFQERGSMEWCNARLKILHVIADTLVADMAMQTAAGQSNDYQGMKFV